MPRFGRALGLGVLAAACVFTRPPSPVTGAIVWRDCDNGAYCAELAAPVDHAASGGPQIELALLRFPAAVPAERIGVLFVNPGGPGISAVTYLRWSIGRYSGPVRNRFDLVAVDPRGTGGSAPLHCHGSLPRLLAQDPNATDDASWQAAVDASRALAEECETDHRALLPFLGTDSNARDLDWVREAMGEEKISYVGYSYGTALGATYASLFPERVRALVLDGSVAPEFDLLLYAREQAVAVENALAAYGAAAKRKGWYGVDTLDEAYASAAKKSDVLYAAAEGVSSPPEGWRELALALGAHKEGEADPFRSLADQYFGRRSDGTSSLIIETHLATVCADVRERPDAEDFRAALPEFAAASPHFGRANLLSYLPCAFWVAPAVALESPGARGLPPILVLANDRDPLTPHVWGERLAARFPTATRVDVRSRAHTAYGQENACVDELVVNYLIAPSAPPVTSCQ